MGKQQTGKQTNIYNLLSRKHLVLDTVQTLFYLITTTSGVRYLGYMCVSLILAAPHLNPLSMFRESPTS